MNTHKGGDKRTDLVLQPIEVYTRLTANRSIDGRHQGRRDIDRTDAPLESSAGKTTHIRNHTAAQIHQQGVTGSPSFDKAVHIWANETKPLFISPASITRIGAF